MTVSGVRSSCEALAMKSRRIISMRSVSVTSWVTRIWRRFSNGMICTISLRLRKVIVSGWS